MEIDPNLLVQDVLAGRLPDMEKAAAWLTPKSLADLGGLMAAACRVRQETVGDAVEFCAIVNARSGPLHRGLRVLRPKRPPPLRGPDLSPFERAGDGGPGKSGRPGRGPALQHRDQRPGLPGRTAPGRHLPGGRAPAQARERLPCASLGLLKPDQARRLAEAGFVRYHHNLEAGPGFFQTICTTHSYSQRVETVRVAKAGRPGGVRGGHRGLGRNTGAKGRVGPGRGPNLNPTRFPLTFSTRF